jgi:hypothetical protein
MTTRITETYLTPRIEACLECGDIDHLFPLLKTWELKELKLLQEELDISYHAARGAMEREYHRNCFRPVFLLTEAGQKALDTRFHADCLELLEVYSEITSVVLFYLAARTALEATQ